MFWSGGKVGGVKYLHILAWKDGKKGNVLYMFWSGRMVGSGINLHVLEWRDGRKSNNLSCFGVDGW